MRGAPVMGCRHCCQPRRLPQVARISSSAYASAARWSGVRSRVSMALIGLSFLGRRLRLPPVRPLRRCSRKCTSCARCESLAHPVDSGANHGTDDRTDHQVSDYQVNHCTTAGLALWAASHSACAAARSSACRCRRITHRVARIRPTLPNARTGSTNPRKITSG